MNLEQYEEIYDYRERSFYITLQGRTVFFHVQTEIMFLRNRSM